MIQSLLPNVGQIFLCKIPQIFDHHNINTKVCLFNELLAERFLDTEDFLTVVDTVQPEIKFYYEDGLHLSNLGISKLCGTNYIRFLLLQATNLVSVPDKIVKHLFEAAVVLNNSMVEVILNRHMGAHSSLKTGCWNVQYFKTALSCFKSLINHFDIYF